MRQDLKNCKTVVDDTVNMATEGVQRYKEEEQHAMSQMEGRHNRQETLSAELNAALQDRVDELVEMVNKLHAPSIPIEEVDDVRDEIPLGVFQTPKETPM